MSPALKVNATYVDYHVVKCVTPPYAEALTDGKAHPTLEVALDDYHFTDHDVQYTYYDPEKLVVSAVDPIGGPIRGGTLVSVLGTGFAQLGGVVMHGSTSFANDSYAAYKMVDAGTFCKFSIDADLLHDDACDDECQLAIGVNGNDVPWVHDGVIGAPPGGAFQGGARWVQSGAAAPGRAGSDALPDEGIAALTRAASPRHVRNYSGFVPSSTPQFGKVTQVMQATFVSDTVMTCLAPKFGGRLVYNRATLDVRVTLNGDWHDAAALSHSAAEYTVYDPREARISHLQRTGGPVTGETHVVISGKLFSDFTLRALPGREHLLRCRFGWIGETDATWVSDNQLECASPPYNHSLIFYHPTERQNWTARDVMLADPQICEYLSVTAAGGTAKAPSPPGRDGQGWSDGQGWISWTSDEGPYSPLGQSGRRLSHVTPVPAEGASVDAGAEAAPSTANWGDAYAPPDRPCEAAERRARELNARRTNDVDPVGGPVGGGGHTQVVSIDVTFNGQDYVRSRHLFFYEPRDRFQVDEGCLNEYGQEVGGACRNNYTGISVTWLQPFGGPADGETEVVVIGRNFAVRGPSIECAFGSLPRVNATFINDTAVLCVAPPHAGVDGYGFSDHPLELTLNGESNFLTRSRVPYVYYRHNATLAVSSVYPRAGTKKGGNRITVFGSGFRVLGGTYKKGYGLDAGPDYYPGSRYSSARDHAEGAPRRGCTDRFAAGGEQLSSSLQTEEGEQEGEQEGEKLSDGTPTVGEIKPHVGTTDDPVDGEYPHPLGGTQALPEGGGPLVCTPAPEDEATNRGIQCIFGNMAPVKAFLVDDAESGLPTSRVVCEAPPLPTAELLAAGLDLDEPMAVCVEVTLNGNASQATRNCVNFTYYDI